MTTTIIITITTLLLLAYVFDISSALTKIPSVIMLLSLGLVVKQVTMLLHIQLPDFNPLLPVLGTIGLILIVLEGSLELELHKSKIPVIRTSILISLIPMFALAFLLAAIFQYYGGGSFKLNLVNAIPFCVISSAIAIPSARNLSASLKEYITYESSLSDIFGVLFFNFIALNEFIDGPTVGLFGLQIVIITVVSFISVIGLSFLLSRIRHHVTFSPIILLVILIYFISKVYHLPGLIFILIFGLFLGNLDEMKRIKWIERLRPDKLNKEIIKFKEITYEATFLIRALFFLLFGFLMDINEIIDTHSLPWAVLIVSGVLIIRWITFKVSKIPVIPFLFMAPRGLITILLFLSIMPEQSIPLVNRSLVIQSIILSVIIMTFGLMINKKDVQAAFAEKIEEKE